MASFIRSIVAGPRKPHAETGLDLCYVSRSNPTIIVMSMPAMTYPRKAYRTALTDIIKFFDENHGDRWSMWEFLAEGTEYADSDVYGRVYHAPWPDHQPPPFHLIPGIMASMRDHLKGGDPAKEGGERVAVLHCKAGKGRSGSMACTYLISEEGWEPEDALRTFTEARMRPGFGEGVSIKSQRRWIKYVHKWTRELGKVYVDHAVEILEIKIWGLRAKSSVAVDGYEDKGKKIKTFHTFHESEKVEFPQEESTNNPGSRTPAVADNSSQLSFSSVTGEKQDVVLRPKTRLIIPNSDACITFSSSVQLPLSFSLITSIAYFWFNAYFHPDGVLKLEWDELDGLKGTYRKGMRTLDRVEIRFRTVGEDHVVKEADPGMARWEDQPGKAEPGSPLQGVGEKGGWLRRDALADEEGQHIKPPEISPPAHH